MNMDKKTAQDRNTVLLPKVHFILWGETLNKAEPGIVVQKVDIKPNPSLQQEITLKASGGS